MQEFKQDFCVILNSPDKINLKYQWNLITPIFMLKWHNNNNFTILTYGHNCCHNFLLLLLFCHLTCHNAISHNYVIVHFLCHKYLWLLIILTFHAITISTFILELYVCHNFACLFLYDLSKHDLFLFDKSTLPVIFWM